MNFTVKCQAIKEYDSQTGAYLKCNCIIEVDSSLVGTMVECPTCGNHVEVHNPNLMQSASAQPEDDDLPLNDIPGDSELKLEPLEPTPKTNAELAMPKSSNKPPQENSTEEDDTFMDLVSGVLEDNDASNSVQDPAPRKTDSLTQNVAATAELKKETIDQAIPQSMNQSNFDRSRTCHKCGTQLEDKQTVCHGCKTPRPAAFIPKKNRVANSSEGPFGFQLWLSSITTAKKNDSDFDYFAIVCYAGTLLIMGWGTFLFIFGGLTAKFFGLVVAISGYCLFTGLQYWGKTRNNPRAPVPLVGKVSWVLLLFLCRRCRFNQSQTESVLDKSGDPEFGDADLANMKNLKRYKVLDLEGTSITDEGLAFLYELQRIQFLVLRNTKVSADGVFEIQQAIPKTWIWY